MIGRALVCVVAATVAFGGWQARAAESTPVSSARAVVSLVSDTDAVAPGKPFQVALRIAAAPGWHIYWQNPGDAGVPPSIDFSLPAGTLAGPIAWPVPERHPEGPVMTYGYTGETVLPVTITPGPFSDAFPVVVHASWLICAKICVPEEGDFRLDLPNGPAIASAQAALFQSAAQRLPVPAPWPVQIGPDGTLGVSGIGLNPLSVRQAWFFPAAWGLVDQSSPQTLTAQEGGFTLAMKPGIEFKADHDLAGVLVLQNDAGLQRAFTVSATPGVVALQTAEPSVPLVRVLLLAALGGLILNLMPCVFPVLAIKAVGLASLRGADRRHARWHAASYVAGVLVTFLALGTLMVALRTGGAAIGWGFQFQSPIFVTAMGWLLFAVGLNLSGLFDVTAVFAGGGQTLVRRSGHAGSFFTGLLAVLVATPCTAPFMGVAIATALTSSASVTLTVFLALGLGFALPFALLALIPAVSRVLPRPGYWMVVLKQVLAFPMYAAALWLIWVLAQEAGPDGVLAAGAGLVLVGLAGWALGLAQHQTLASNRGGRRIAHLVAIAATAAAVAILPTIMMAPASKVTASADAGTEPFTTARLAALRAEGHPVFVNMTAAWCVTCLVNERLALSPDSVRRAFAARHVTYLKGDWTRQDPQITAFLRAHGRDGVPLYVMYPANSGAPTVMSQVLTEGEMIAELNRAGG